MGLRSMVKKGAKKAKKGAGKVAKKAKKTASKAAKETKKGVTKAAKETKQGVTQTAKKIGKETAKVTDKIEDLADDLAGDIMSILDDVKKLAGKLKSEVQSVGKTVENGVKSVGREAERGVKTVGSEAEKGLRTAGSEIEDTFEKRIPELVTEQLPEAMKALAEDLASEAMKPALQVAAQAVEAWHEEMAALAEEDPELVDAINSLGFSVEVKLNVVLKLSYSQFYTRAQTTAAILRRYATEGIALRRRDIIGFVDSTGPTSVDFGVGAGVTLGVDAGVKFQLDAVPLKLFTRLGDRGLKRVGVPE